MTNPSPLSAAGWFSRQSFHQADVPASEAATLQPDTNACPRCPNGRLGKNGVCGSCWTRCEGGAVR